MVAMADALGREYHTLPTDILGLQLSPGKKVLVNARILAYRNEQAKLMSMADKSTGTSGPSLSDRIKAKRMASLNQREKNLRDMGIQPSG
jgi:hypothetical protein